MRPFLIVLAGVNGAGKSSVLSTLLLDEGLDWYNPDRYAADLVRGLGMGLGEANARAWQHGKSLLERAIATRANHAFETTLGGNTITRLLREASKTHDLLMLYCGLASPELHIARVAQRVAHRGHPIPEAKIRERWNTSRSNLVQLLPVLSRLQVFDNSRSVEAGQDVPDPALVMELEAGRVVFPDIGSRQALAAVPAWAQPVLEAAIQQQR
ncbi:MAG TPA: AAA family ATPase [Ramlibacter sp.]|uniref:AAA family ATPase n=1 Tax=Ramlibacter sp. TaxID=1917967 RepID=UPI002D7FEBC4|nr:AAA family ATPase [Ramlibacter sp.]HET8744745.1 AAA family ATPase [Ramlibacter sp.]